MNYQRIYNQIIERAQNRKLKGYSEKHHIIPKCLGGDDNEKNLVDLTAREHFLCHLLLVEIYPKKNKLKHALFLMAIGKQKIKEKHYYINSRTYERLKIEFSLFLTGKNQTKKTKLKKSKSMKNVWKNKTIEEKSKIGSKIWETRRKNGTTNIKSEKRSKALKGLKRSESTKKNMGKSVLQYDLENNFIKKWNSCAEAERYLHKNKTNIQNAANGRQKTAYGYKWKYEK